MTGQILFSVVIPAYNRAHCIREAILSVQRQTEQRFEIVVVDDGSKDNTKEVIENINDNRIRYIYQSNSGGAKARNTGIKNAVGNYIAFLDSDDEFLPEHLSQALPVLECGENICTYAPVIVHRGGGVKFNKPQRGLVKDEHISDYLICNRGFVPTITLIIPRELAVTTLYDEKLKYGQDIDFTIRLVANGGGLTMLNSPSAIWNDEWSPSRTSSRIDPEMRLEWLNGIKDKMTKRAYYSICGWSIAKGYSQKGEKAKGLLMYVKSLVRGCYSPKMAMVVFLQVALSSNNYRKLSDQLAKLGIKP